VNSNIITVTIVYSRKIIHKVVVFLISKLFLEYFLFVLRVIIFLIEMQPQNVAGFKMAPGALPLHVVANYKVGKQSSPPVMAAIAIQPINYIPGQTYLVKQGL
jgi:hypothetical protein